MTKKELIEHLTELFGSLPAIVERHIDFLIKNTYTPKEIARACYYIYGVLGKDKDDIVQYGIKGLVPLYVDKANLYYENIKKQKELQEKQLEKRQTIQIRKVTTLKRIKPGKEIDIDDIK